MPDSAELHELDRGDALADVVAEAKPEVVFHVAAQAGVGTSVERPAFDADVNVVGTIRVLEAARSVDARIVFSSTGGAIYGEYERPGDLRRSILDPTRAGRELGWRAKATLEEGVAQTRAPVETTD